MVAHSLWSREPSNRPIRRYGSVTIPLGESLSDAIQIDMASNVAVQVDTVAWTAAGISFQVSLDGVSYSDLLTSAGEVTMASDAAGRAYPVPEAGGFRFLKVRSGTSGTPVVQAADRTINVSFWDN